MTISERIRIHADIYRQAGLNIPPYRLTYKEHSDLVQEFNSMINAFKPMFQDLYEQAVKEMKIQHSSFITSCYGVDIEIVVPIL